MSPFSRVIRRFSRSFASSLFARQTRWVALAVLLLASVQHSSAAQTATAAITSSPASGGSFQYSIDLTNTGTSNIGTFWFAWVPGEDFLPVSPISETSPTGWTAAITHGGANDGFAIQWIAAPVDVLAPGGSLDFVFDTTATPAQIAGDSPFFPTTPVGTSFVYQGSPFSGASEEFVASVTAPEPSVLALSLLSFAMTIGFLMRSKMGLAA